MNSIDILLGIASKSDWENMEKAALVMYGSADWLLAENIRKSAGYDVLTIARDPRG